VPASSPQVDCLQVEHACRWVCAREAALQQLREGFVELVKRQMQPTCRLLRRHVAWIDAVADLCLSRAGHPTIMFLLMQHRNSRQMRVVRLDAKANKREIVDTFVLT
jgi:hypothetical protein